MKKFAFWILSVVLVIVIGGTAYVAAGSNARKNYVKDYLESKGYSQSQFQNIEVKHSFLNAVLGYQQWIIWVEFTDEQGIVYCYHYDRAAGVYQGSFSGDNLVYGDLEKEELLERLKHLER